MTSPSAAHPHREPQHGPAAAPRPLRPGPVASTAAGQHGGRVATGTSRRATRATRAFRTVCTVGTVCASLAVLAGCEKPTPLATVTTGEDSVHTQADCYNDGNAISTDDLQSCLRNKNATTLKVDPDAIVRFGVDPDIADQGWAILLNGQPLTDRSGKTYRTIPGSVFFNPQYGATGASTTVSILEGNGSKATGLWSFRFTKRT